MTVTLPVKVRYAETDRMGIVHHKNYLVWYEEARTLFSDQVGVPYSEIEKMADVMKWTPTRSEGV